MTALTKEELQAMAAEIAAKLNKRYCHTVDWKTFSINYDETTGDGFIDSRYRRVLPNGYISEELNRTFITDSVIGSNVTLQY